MNTLDSISLTNLELSNAQMQTVAGDGPLAYAACVALCAWWMGPACLAACIPLFVAPGP